MWAGLRDKGAELQLKADLELMTGRGLMEVGGATLQRGRGLNTGLGCEKMGAGL